MKNLDPNIPPTPCFVVDLAALRRNLEILNGVRRRAGVKILLAQKAFSMFAVYPLISAVLDGTCASSPHEARLGREEFGKETHGFAAAYSESDLRELLRYCTTVVFNSFSQWRRFRELTKEAAGRVKFGLRVNPEHGEAVCEIYSPCAPKSRLGIKRAAFAGESLDGISGLHFHTLCEQDSDALERTMAAFEEHFGDLLGGMRWVNFGGGHHITRPGYDLERLVRILTEFRARHPHLTVYLEPGEAVVLNAGSLFGTVLDIVQNDGDIAILDVSAEAHMPDVIEMPYTPPVNGAAEPGVHPYEYRLAGHSCLAGDVIGDYSFPAPLKVGDRVEFLDMALYTMVKTNTFNGLALPSIATFDPDTGEFKLIKAFGYDDFKNRLS